MCESSISKTNSIAPIKKVFSIFQSVYFMFFALANSAKMPFFNSWFPMVCPRFVCYRIKWSTCEFCEIQWPRPPLFSPSLLIQWSMGEGVLYNLVFTERRHCVSQNEVWGRGYYITLFSPSDVTEFHRILWNAVTSSKTLLNGYSMKTMLYNTPAPILYCIR